MGVGRRGMSRLATSSFIHILLEDTIDPFVEVTKESDTLCSCSFECRICIKVIAVFNKLIYSWGLKMYELMVRKIQPDPATCQSLIACDDGGLDNKYIKIDIQICSDYEGGLPFSTWMEYRNNHHLFQVPRKRRNKRQQRDVASVNKSLWLNKCYYDHLNCNAVGWSLSVNRAIKLRFTWFDL